MDLYGLPNFVAGATKFGNLEGGGVIQAGFLFPLNLAVPH
jgi:hypothetical protein